jgi:hypothetical protein
VNLRKRLSGLTAALEGADYNDIRRPAPQMQMLIEHTLSGGLEPFWQAMGPVAGAVGAGPHPLS